jgi:uncharacterized protein YndB with AHSA1/START domain
MSAPTNSPSRILEVRRIFNAPPQRIFEAWTRPEALQRWWGVAEGYTTPLAEVDLRVGGSYRLGMLPPDGEDLLILVGEYQAIEPPDRLVFTWGLEGQQPSLITLRFIARGSRTELVLTHNYEGTEEMAARFQAGWNGMFERLAKIFPA